MGNVTKSRKFYELDRFLPVILLIFKELQIHTNQVFEILDSSIGFYCHIIMIKSLKFSIFYSNTY